MAKNSGQRFDDVINPIINDFNTLSPLFAEAIRRIKQQRGLEDVHEPESALTNKKSPRMPDFGPKNVEFNGLEKHFRGCLNTLSDSSSESQFEECHRWICSAHEWIENYMSTKVICAERLTPRTRDIRGWLAYFSQVENFHAYISALATAKPVFNAAIKSSNGKYSLPLTIHFSPVKNLRWIYAYENCTQASLRTSLIGFDTKAFSALADHVFLNKKNQQEIKANIKAGNCLKIQSEIEALSNADLKH